MKPFWIGTLLRATVPPPATDWMSTLFQLGACGAVLAWFMFRSEPRLRAIEAAIDRMARAVLLLVVALPGANPASKESAKDILRELDEAEKKRNG